MRNPIAIALSAAVLVAGGAIAVPAWAALTTQPQPSGADRDFFLGADWDDDDWRPNEAMPRPSVAALRAAGVVRVTDVERDRGRIEVEGYDAQGRELNIRMDANGQRVLSVRHDRDWDDRFDDWDD